MIKINSFEHVYGIKKLNNSSLINQNTIIYSPNGVMKSSLTDGLHIISSNQDPKDVFYNAMSTYEIDNNGIIVNELSTTKHLDLVVFKGEDVFDSIFTNPSIAKIVVSVPLKKQYESKIASIKSKVDLIKEKLASLVLEEKKSAKTSGIDEFLSRYEGNNDLDKIINLLAKPHNIIKEDVSSLNFSSLFNGKTEPILNDPAFKTKAAEYQALKNVKLNEKIFSNGFSIQELQNIHDLSVKSKYYAAGHKFAIDNIVLDKDGVDKLIQDSIITAYGSDEMKASFQSAKGILEKNNDSRKIVKALSDNPWLLERLSEPQQFKEDLIFKKIESAFEDINVAKNEIEETKKQIEKIFEDAKSADPVWKKVIETYNQRFINKHFDIAIRNQINAIVGIQEPVFVKLLKGTNVEITGEIFQRFSSGEKRAIFILYLLYEIELKKAPGLNITLVADDIVDSFDYKNKYAMIEYLSEISNDQEIQLIILTHNFDFFRSCLHSFGHNIQSELFAYLDNNDEVTLFKANSKNYESFRLFGEWKNNNDTKSLISLIPFLRNLVELKSGDTSTEYSILCEYLHFKPNTANLDLGSLATIYDDYGIIHSSITTDKYWNLLVSEVKGIVSPVVESDIQIKLIFGLFIRLSTDLLLLTKYRNNNGGAEPAIPSGSNWTKQLYKRASCYLSADEKKLYDRAISVAPSFIHVNSFMYEPLIDIGSERLLSISREMIVANAL